MKIGTFNDFLAMLPEAVEVITLADQENIDYIDRLEGINVGHYSTRIAELEARASHERMVVGAPTMRTMVELGLAEALSTTDDEERMFALAEVAATIAIWCSAIAEREGLDLSQYMPIDEVFSDEDDEDDASEGDDAA